MAQICKVDGTVSTILSEAGACFMCSNIYCSFSFTHEIKQYRLVARYTCTLVVAPIYFPISLQANDGFRLNFLPYFNKDCS